MKELMAEKKKIMMMDTSRMNEAQLELPNDAFGHLGQEDASSSRW
jgi:hypothetical protein